MCRPPSSSDLCPTGPDRLLTLSKASFLVHIQNQSSFHLRSTPTWPGCSRCLHLAQWLGTCGQGVLSWSSWSRRTSWLLRCPFTTSSWSILGIRSCRQVTGWWALRFSCWTRRGGSNMSTREKRLICDVSQSHSSCSLIPWCTRWLWVQAIGTRCTHSLIWHHVTASTGWCSGSRLSSLSIIIAHWTQMTTYFLWWGQLV